MCCCECCHRSGADPGWSVTGSIEAKIGTKGANFARFWSILEGAVPPRPPSGSTTVDIDVQHAVTFDTNIVW